MFRFIAYIMIVLGLASVGGLIQYILYPERGGGLIDIIVYVLIIYITYRMMKSDRFDEADEYFEDSVKHYPRDDDTILKDYEDIKH